MTSVQIIPKVNISEVDNFADSISSKQEVQGSVSDGDIWRQHYQQSVLAVWGFWAHYTRCMSS